MPRYFFHVIDGKDLPDNVGTVLANADEARAEAIVLSGAMLKKFRRPRSGTMANGKFASSTKPATRCALSRSRLTALSG